MRRIGILVAIALIAHVWMQQAAGAPMTPSAMTAAHTIAATSSALPDPGHCPHGMTACLVQLPPASGDDLVLAVLLTAAAVPLVARRRDDGRITRSSAAPSPLPRIAVPSSVVLRE